MFSLEGIVHATCVRLEVQWNEMCEVEPESELMCTITTAAIVTMTTAKVMMVMIDDEGTEQDKNKCCYFLILSRAHFVFELINFPTPIRTRKT